MFLIRIIYYCIAIACIGISIYLTYFGFLRSFGALTLPFAILIGLALLGADLLIQRNRERSEPILGPLLFLCFAAFFSGVSNFNYLYTNFMTSDVLAQTLREQYRVFNDDLTSTDAELGSIQAVRQEVDRRSSVETELKQMWEQMTDSSRPGCGTRCANHINRINGLIGTTITDLRRPGPSASDQELKTFFDAFSNLVYAALDNTNIASNYLEVAALQEEIADRIRYFDTADAAIRAGIDLSILAELSRTSLDIERKANALLPANSQVEHQYIDPTLGRLGEIVYSLHNGFVEMPNTGVTLLSLIISILVDFVPMLFALIAFRPGESILPEEDEVDFDVIN